MENNKSYFRLNKRFASVLHHIVLFAMLHSTFVAPAQGLIEAYLNKKEKHIYKGLTEKSTPALKTTLPGTSLTATHIAPNGIYSTTAIWQPLAGNSKAAGKLILHADLKEGIIGTSASIPVDNPSDNLFTIQIDTIPQNSSVYLTYELYGVSGHHSVARSINNRQSTGGYIIKNQPGWSLQKEEINAAWLKKGENNILFTIPKGAGYQYKIKNLSVEIEKTGSANPLLVVARQNIVLSKDNTIYIKGFLKGSGKGARIYAGTVPLAIKDNEFEGFITLTEEIRKNKFIVIRAADSNGLLGQELLMLDNLLEADRLFPITEKQTEASALFTAHTKAHLNIDGASIALSDSALTKDFRVSVTQLRTIDIAPVESGMVNVTRGGKGYRFLPDGTTFDKPVRITIAYDTLLLPHGYSPKDIRTYFFDTHSKHWKEVKKDSTDSKNQTITSVTNHFTDYINGVIQVPESPETNASLPTAMSDIKAADPSSEITLISPPQASQKGDANISYPIKIPAGRGGLQPQVSLQYSNQGGNGWLGLGWNINTPAITIDTRWGVPVFDTTKETELYSLNGEQLMYANGYMPNRHQVDANNVLTTDMPNRSAGTVNFYPRKQGSFDKIERLGTGPTNYCWKVTGTNGTISWYGGKNTVNNDAVIKDSAGNIVHWALYMVEDVYSNNIKYKYYTGSVSTTGGDANLSGGHFFYLQNIYYTGFGG